MGMTRLGLCLLCLAVVFALPMLRYLFRSFSFLATDDVANIFSSHWRLGIALFGAPMAGLGILLLLRPEDLLRWTPTGKAWAQYRIGHVANAAFARAELASQFSQVTTFALANDPVDAPMAQRLREELLALGGSEVAPGKSVIPVLLLTGRTQLAWIDANTEQVRNEGITVVGTGIDLTPNLDWLWRRQWIDFRVWDVRKADRALALPQVPVAVTQTRLPTSVARARHVLCAIAALLFALGGAVSPEDRQQGPDLSFNELLAYVTFAAAVWWALIAHRLVKRSRTQALLRRDALIGSIVTAIVVGLDFYALGNGKLAVGRMAIAAAFLVAAWLWLWRRHTSLAFWLPQENLTRAAKRSVLGTYRDWSTLIWLFVYALLWMSLLGFVD